MTKMKKHNTGKSQDEKLNELFDAIARVAFEPAEKARLSSRLEAFVDYHPMVEVVRESKEHPAGKPASMPSPFSAPALSPFSRFSAERFSEWATFGRKKVIVATALVLCVFAGSVSAAASDALPGDILYPVKIHVNENVGIMLSIGAKSEAKKQISYADARLAEAEALSAQNKLNSQTQALVKENFAAEASKVSDKVRNLEAKGQVAAAAEISSDFDAYLESHRDLLLAMSEQGDVQGGLLADLASTVDIHLSANAGDLIAEVAELTGGSGQGEVMMLMATEAPAASASRTSAKAVQSPEEATSTSVPSGSEGDKARAEGARTSAKNKIDAAYAALNQSQTANVDASIIEAASAQVNQAQKLFKRGEASVSADQYRQAYALFNQAGRSAQRARLALDSHVAVKPVISIFLRLGGDEWVESSATSSEEIPVTATTSARVKGNSTTTTSATTSKGNSSSTIRVENNTKNSVETRIEVKTSTGGQTSTGLNGSLDIDL